MMVSSELDFDKEPAPNWPFRVQNVGFKKNSPNPSVYWLLSLTRLEDLIENCLVVGVTMIFRIIVTLTELNGVLSFR